MIPPFLSETMIPGDWVLSLVKIIIGGLTGGSAVWWITKRNTKQSVQIEDPSKVQTERVYSPPTFWQHRALERRVGAIETRQDAMDRENRDNFLKLMEAGEARQNRLMDKMDDMKAAINKRIDEKLK